MNEQKLKLAFAQALGIDESAIVDELAYQSIPQWDSVAHMSLIAALEDDFDVMLETNEVIDMSSVAKAKEILSRYEIEFA
jgi:acyl carrier protein